MAKEAETKPTQKTCFVVTQIGEEDSPERIHADWVFEEILEPIFLGKFKNFDLVRSDKISSPGLIDIQIIKNIIDADLVIADLTNTNPNVFYEIGIRHVIKKPIIHMHLKGQKIPFDISLYRSLSFTLSRPSDLRLARREMEVQISAAIAPDFVVDNPVARAIASIDLESRESEIEIMLGRQIESLSMRMNELEGSINKRVSNISMRSGDSGGGGMLVGFYPEGDKVIDKSQEAEFRRILLNIFENSVEAYSIGRTGGTVFFRKQISTSEILSFLNILRDFGINMEIR